MEGRRTEQFGYAYRRIRKKKSQLKPQESEKRAPIHSFEQSEGPTEKISKLLNIPLGASALLQLHQNRGRLPPYKKESFQKILLDELQKQHIRGIPIFTYRETSKAPPNIGEIDIDATCASAPPREKHQFVVRHKETVLPQISLLLDVSASLTPEQRYLSLVVVYSLYSLALPMSIQIFSTTAKNIANAAFKKPIHSIIHDIQYTLPSEYTNVHAGLMLLAKQQKNCLSPLNISIIISDFVRNYGPKVDKNTVYLPHLFILSLHASNNQRSIVGFPNTPTYNLSNISSVLNALHAIQTYSLMHTI